MFVTGNDGVYRAQMDGTGFTDVKVGYGSAGIAVVPDSDRVYHVNFIYHQVVSMNRDGSDIIRLGGSGGFPWGVAIVGNNSIHWGTLTRILSCAFPLPAMKWSRFLMEQARLIY